MALFAELRRRNVFKVALLFAVASWLVVWLLDGVRESVTLPVWTETFVYFLIIVGFPLALLIAWAFELTPEGLKREKDVDRGESISPITGRKLDRVIIGQRLGFVYADPQFSDVFAKPLDAKLAALISESGDDELTTAYLENCAMKKGFLESCW